MKPFLTLLVLTLGLAFSSSSYALGGIASAGYIWLLVPVLIVVIGLLLATVKFLKRVKSDCTAADTQPKD
jgi:hypothetical protein